MKRIIAVAVAASAVQLAVTPARAAIEEQIVTTQRRAENIQSVPVSVTAFGAGDLERLGVNDPQSLADFTPNLSIGDGTGRSSVGAQFSIRGVNEARIAPVLDPAVGVYIDDVYYGRPETNFLKLLDVERVEVLRGPQGTLFGKNSTGGAIRYVTKRPDTSATAGRLKVGAGNFDQRKVEGSFNLPLSDTAAVRFAAAHIEEDGYVKRLSDGVKLGADETDFFNGQFRWIPSDTVVVDFNVSYTESSDNGGATKLIDYYKFNGQSDTTPPFFSPGISNIAAHQVIYPMGTPEYYQPAIPADLYTIAGDGPVGSTDTESTGVGLDISWDLSDTLTLRSISGYRENETLENRESDDSAFANTFFDGRIASGVDFWSQEFQLNGESQDGVWNWVAGVFYSEEEPFLIAYEDHDLRPSQGTQFGAIQLLGNALQTTKSTGVFAQTDWSVTERTTLTLGLRWSQDDKTYRVFEDAVWDPAVDQRLREIHGDATCIAANGDIDACYLTDYDTRPGSNVIKINPKAPTYVVDGVSCNPSQQARCRTGDTLSGGDTFESWTPRVAVEFQASDDVMLYAAASKGFKSGGTNDTVDDIDTPFQPEELWSYEAGVRLSSENIRANLTAFTMDYMDKQLTVTTSPNCNRRCTTNIGDARISGIEAEMLAQLTDSLRFNLGIGTLDAEWTDIQNLSAGVEEDSKFSRAPALSADAGLRHDLMLASGGTITSSFNVAYKSEQESSGQDSTTLTIPAYSIANARITYSPAGDRWSAALFCTNCFDREYITGGAAWAGGTDGSGFNYKPDSHPAFVDAPNPDIPELDPAANAPPGITIVNVGAPLFWGVEFTYNFGD